MNNPGQTTKPGDQPQPGLTSAARYRISNPLHICLFLLSLIPLIVLIVMVRTYGSNTPFWDQWDSSYPVATQSVQGKLTLDTLFAQHNEHRLFFTNAVTALVTLTTRWDVRVEMLVSIMLACINLILVLVLLYHHQPPLMWILLVPFSILFFSLRQYENWLWGFQTQWYFVTAFLLGAIVALTVLRTGWRALAIAAVCAACSTYSLSAGALSWGLILGGIWLLGYRDWRYYLFWGAAAAITLAVYFAGYTWGDVPGGEQVMDPLRLATNTTLFLSNAFFTDFTNRGPRVFITCLSLVGLLLLVADVVYIGWKERKSSALSPWLMIAGMGGGSALIVSLGRTQLGLAYAGSSRYVALSELFWVGVIAIGALVIWKVWREEKRRRWEWVVAAGNLAAIVVLMGLSVLADFNSVKGLKAFAATLRSGGECVEAYPVTQGLACTKEIYLTPQALSVKVQEMTRLRLGVFAKPYELPLSFIPLRVSGTQTQTTYTAQRINGVDIPVLLQDAPSQVAVVLRPMQGYGQLILKSAIYVNPGYPTVGPGMPPGGVVFRISAIGQSKERTVLFEKVFDPQVDREPIPFQIDLSAFAGNRFQLEFETDPRSTADNVTAMWVNPILTADRATYSGQ